MVDRDIEILGRTPMNAAFNLLRAKGRRIQRTKGDRCALVNAALMIEEERETGDHPGSFLTTSRQGNSRVVVGQHET
jgi:hypothetical protein